MLERLRAALSATLELRRDPEDIAKAVRQFDAISLLLGRGDKTMLGRMRETPLGRRLLEERHAILEIVEDRERLLALPEGSLGHSYARFALDKRLFPEELAQAVREARAASAGLVPEASDEIAYLHDRYRDLHDLWHVLVGYDTDLAGEFALIAFQTKQTGYRSMAIGAFASLSFAAVRGRFDMFSTWFDARRRGSRSAFLLSQDWERLLPLPLEQVRRELAIDSPPSYRPFDYPKAEAA
jgi:ubiquinone biosynthesis protein COQ4